MKDNHQYNLQSGHLPKLIRMIPLKSYYNGKNRSRKPMRSYHDLNEKTSFDFKNLDIPIKDDHVMAVCSAPKNLKIKKGQEFIENEEMKVKFASAEGFLSYNSVKEPLNVLLPQGYIVGIQPDVFFEAIMKDGFNHQTKELNSTFIFGAINGSVKLIRVGSDLHKAILEKEKFDSLPKIDIKTMSVGEVFETKTGKEALFLGFVSTKWLNPEIFDDGHVDIKYSNTKMGTLWLDIDYTYWDSSQKKRIENISAALQSGNFDDNLMFKTKGGHGYVNKSKMYVNVSTDIVRRARMVYNSKLKNSLNRDDMLKKFEDYLNDPSKYTTKYNRRYGSSWSNLSSNGGNVNVYQARNLEYIALPDLYDIKRWCSATKMTNMIVFGMKPEKGPASLELEKLIKLHNQKIDKNLG